jgi:hypothetical protein
MGQIEPARKRQRTLASREEIISMRHNLRAGLMVLAVLAGAAPASAQQQSVSVNLGGFFVRGTDGRINDDVLVQNLDFLVYLVDDFDAFTISGEYLFGFGEYLEAGAGLGFYSRSVPTVYGGVVDDDGTEVEQKLKLRIAPITLTARFLPLGRRGPVEPYVGGGVAFYNWRYSESGEFVDFRDGTIFTERYIAQETDIGPVFIAGLRVPTSQLFAIGAEFQYQGGKGTVGVENGFYADKIDLGGYNALVTLQFRF